MIKIAASLLLLLAAAALLAAQTPSSTPTARPTAAPTTPPVVPHTSLKVGQAAPDFTLASTIAGSDGRSMRYKLSDFKGKKNVVLAFYVLAFTGG
jgi:AhpC/TSA family